MSQLTLIFLSTLKQSGVDKYLALTERQFNGQFSYRDDLHNLCDVSDVDRV